MARKTAKKDEQIMENPPAAAEEISEGRLHGNEPIVEGEPREVENNIFGKPEGELVVDVFETKSDFVVLTAIAGVQIKDLDISVEKDMMIIKGKRNNPHNDSGKKYFFQECYWGPFSKKIILPENINTEEADAQMDKGMLMIKIPKTAAKEKPNIKVS